MHSKLKIVFFKISHQCKKRANRIEEDRGRGIQFPVNVNAPGSNIALELDFVLCFRKRTDRKFSRGRMGEGEESNFSREKKWSV